MYNCILNFLFLSSRFVLSLIFNSVIEHYKAYIDFKQMQKYILGKLEYYFIIMSTFSNNFLVEFECFIIVFSF